GELRPNMPGRGRHGARKTTGPPLSVGTSGPLVRTSGPLVPTKLALFRLPHFQLAQLERLAGLDRRPRQLHEPLDDPLARRVRLLRDQDLEVERDRWNQTRQLEPALLVRLLRGRDVTQLPLHETVDALGAALLLRRRQPEPEAVVQKHPRPARAV